MTPYELRAIEPDEQLAFLDCMGTAFFRRTSPAFAAWWRENVGATRSTGVFDGAELVATMRSFRAGLSLPGGSSLAASALTNVTVSPPHRRRGLLSSMMHKELEASVERGEAVSVLVAAEWPIYGRFGYGPAVEAADYRIETRAARFLAPPEGTVRLSGVDELLEAAPVLYEQARRLSPGAIERPAPWWDLHLGRVDPVEEREGAAFHALYRSPAGKPEGFVSYRAVPRWEAMRPDASLVVEDLVCLTPRAYAALWSYLCSVDLVREVRAARRPVEEPLPLLLADGRAMRQVERYDLMWARVLDPEVALPARRYALAGELVLRVDDPLGHAAGTWRLEAGPDGATCTRAAGHGDVRLGIAALGSLYLGGCSAERLQAAGLVEELRTGAVEQASTMFRSAVPPSCPTFF